MGRRSLRALHWNEAKHPRDDRGRFARKGGARWATAVVRQAEARFADTAMHNPETPIRAGRRPGGLILVGPTQGPTPFGVTRPGQSQQFEGTPTAFKEARYLVGREILKDGEWHQITGFGFGGDEGDHIMLRSRTGEPSQVTARETGGQVLVRNDIAFRPGRALEGAQRHKMDQWRADAQKAPPFRTPLVFEATKAKYERDMAKAEADLAEATRKARNRARRKYPSKEGYGAYTRDDYVDQETWREQHNITILKAQIEYLMKEKEGSYNQRPDTGTTPIMTGKIDRSRPLAVYGNMLHADAFDEVSFRALRELEEIPAELHALVAAEMFRNDAAGKQWRTSNVSSSGIFVGNRPVSELDGLNDLEGVKPRGWSEGKTFHDVDGVFRPTTMTVAVGQTANTRGKNHSAAKHEFGHALDDALGQLRRQRGGDPQEGGEVYRGDESGSPEWRALYHKAMKAAGKMLNPYFRQQGDAGPSEFWADAFGTWSKAWVEALRRVQEPDQRRWTERAGGVEEAAAREVERTLSRTYDINDVQMLRKLHDYFHQLTQRAGVQWL